MLKKSSDLKLTATTTTAAPVKVTTATTAATKQPKAIAVAKKLPQSKTSSTDNCKTIPSPKKSPSLHNNKATSTIAKTMQASSKIQSQATTTPSLKTINSVNHDLSFPLLTVTVQNDRPRLIVASNVLENSTENRLPIEHMVKPNELTLTKKVLLKNTSLKYASSENQSVHTAENTKRPETSVDVVKEMQCEPSIDINKMSMLKPEDELLTKSDITDSADLFNKSEVEKMDLLKSSEREYSKHRYIINFFKKVVLFSNFNTIHLAYSSKFLSDLETMYQLVCLTQQEAEKERSLEKQVDELRRKLKLVEEQFLQQKIITHNLFPNIAASHRALISNRQLSVKLANHCMTIGKDICGDEYK